MPLFYPVVLSCAEILGGENGKCVSEVLHRHIGNGVDFYRYRKCRHNSRTEAVDKSLYHQYAEIHYRLLKAGKARQRENIPDITAVEFHIAFMRNILLSCDEKIKQ